MSGSNWIKFNRGWWSPYLLCILTAASATPESPNLRRPDLTGTVRDEDGKPVAAASVFIYTAGPKEGVGILCPSCYADCRKRTRTDGDGHFKIESLDPALQFRLLVVARGHRPEFVGKVDPAKRPVEVTLAPGKTDVSPDLQVKGRVVDSERKPVSGAVISIREVKRGESTQYGGNEDIDRVAVSDDEGLFVVNGENRFDAVGVEIEARALAKGIFHELATGGKIHELQLTEGAAVHGRVIKNGKPLGGVEIGICGADRTAEEYVGDFSVGTDKEGRFSLGNLPPNRDYFVYAKMSSLAGKDSLPARRVKLKRDASSEDLGDLAVSPGFTLTGQIQLTDGNSVPPKTRLLLSRDEAWDSAQTEADERGRFTFRGVPPESFGLSARIKGYRLSARNRSLDTMNPFHLVGVIKADKTDLILEFEPEKNPSPRLGNYVEMRQEPLLGAELVKNRVGDIQVTGTVSDAESGKPIKRFTITEGRAGNFPQPTQWFPARQTEGANGKLDLFLNRHGSAPVILVEAEGYLPQASGAITGAETNLAFALKKGVGPSGVILKPNGEPAAGATVYLADMQNGVYVQDKSMKVQDRMYQGLRSVQADEQGKFSFKAHADDYAILILEDEGFAQVLVPDLNLNPKVTLQPWAKVQGTLQIGSKPGANETVRLWPAHLPYEHHPRSFPPLSLFLHTQTDEAGQFSFERVPPIAIQVYHSPKLEGRGMGEIPMTQTANLALQPGETATMALGGHGRPITGQLVVTGYDGKINWRGEVYHLELILPAANEIPDLAAVIQERSAKIRAADSDNQKARLIAEMQNAQEEAVAQQRAFYRTDKGREYYFQNRRYALNVAADGRFRIDDVPGGKYRLRLDLREAGSVGANRLSAPRIASLDKELDIPDSPGGRTDEAFDLGTIEIQARKVLAQGAAAPDFQATTVEGQPLKLADFAGKYVLLDFWAVWCGPCVAETPYLKATYESFGKDPRFRMVGLSLDPNVKAPREYAEKNDLDWIMGFLGDWSKTELPSQYGVEGIPSIFLIGPDGRILAKDLRGENIKATVERVLTAKEPAKSR